ncbi:SDR family oxidoreductase [Bowmanella dokdonensis]|uniref:3-oxoacyl-[acyl-carrier-protein] reductase FabG n=1 Tax=Bowmanella dokdonensis TaxID=751969 RepID=A0A939IM87_9ALTE|nr:SDR family oxidoreductase [Bowmanella dokdonensis]MBN7825043.1 SDR family oxidoreductase [Bowmanella dokdonensis]
MTQSKTVLVTGGSRGIGAATSLLLASQGYQVAVNYLRQQDEASQLVEKIRSGGGQAQAFQADISHEAQVIRLFEQIDSLLGPVTHLVNNAAILLPQSRLIDMDVERISRLLQVNVTGTFLCCREALKRMQSGAAIVNVSSVAARTGSPNEYIDYAASKGAIDSLTRGLAVEVAPQGIRVNAVRPGFIHTRMHADGGEPERIERLKSRIPMGRGGEPEEVAAAIAWLLSDQASYLTGTFMDLAGGV